MDAKQKKAFTQRMKDGRERAAGLTLNSKTNPRSVRGVTLSPVRTPAKKVVPVPDFSGESGLSYFKKVHQYAMELHKNSAIPGQYVRHQAYAISNAQAERMALDAARQARGSAKNKPSTTRKRATRR